MNKNATIAPFQKKKDLLSELIDKDGIDEMGLLDLVFIEEILNQKHDRVKKA